MPDGMNPQDADAFLGPAPAAKGMSADDANAFLGPISIPGMGTFLPKVPSPEQDTFLKNTSIGRVMSAFGQGVENAWGTSDLGLTPEAEGALKKAGVLPDVAKGQGGILRAFNEGLIRPAAAALDAAFRVPGALYSGAQATGMQVGAELGAPELARDLVQFPDAFAGSPAALHAPHPIDLPAAREMGAIGEPESAYMGTSEPVNPAPENAVKANVQSEVQGEPVPAAPEPAGTAPEPEPAAPAAEPAPTPAQDVHGLARQIAPDTFDEYDQLSAHQDNLRQQITAAQADLQKNFEAQAPGAAEIADLEARMQDTTPRLAKKYQARLDALVPERDALLNNEDGQALVTRDTPEITALRQQLLETDFRMRDLAPQVSDAYRQAAEQMPAPEEPVAEPETGTAAAPVAQEAAAVGHPAEATPAQAPEPVQAETPRQPVQPVADIAADVSQKLQAAGRPVDEADAAGQVSKALWETRAAAFEGKKGTPEEMYAREAPEIRGERVRGRVMELAQKGRELEQRPAQTETPEFKNWFGNSKVTDENGEPQRVYHGTVADFDTFDADKGASRGGGQDSKRAFFFTTEPEVADTYAVGENPYRKGVIGAINKATGGLYEKVNEAVAKKVGLGSQIESGENIIPTYLAAKNPLVVDMNGRPYDRNRFLGEIHMAQLEGHDGVLFKNVYDNGFKDSDKQSDVWAVFKPEQIKSAIGNRGTFDPADANILHQGAQGKIRLTQDGRSVITLMKSANASTFLHETGHDWLERMVRDAADPDAPEAMRTDAATVRKYLGVGDGEALTTRAHEKFARSFERYFMEGRAPTQALAGVFAKFKDWLTTIYQTVSKLRAPITPDIRDVFDRLLTTEPDRQAAIVPETAAEGAQGELPVEQPAAKPTPLFPKLPKPPISITGWIRKLGGVRDEGGEIAQMLDKQKLPGLLNKGGMNLDDMTRKLWEDGYLPEFHERPTIQEMLAVLEDDLKGRNPRFSEFDRDQVQAYQDAVAHNEEIERLSHTHDIDTTGLTREQFFEELSKKLSEEKQAEEMRSQEEAHEAAFGEFAAEAREDAESRMGHWDSDAFYGIDGPRTEAELEAGYDGQADAAGPARQGPEGSGDAGPAGRSAADGEEGGGPRDGGAGDAGRPRQAISQPPAGGERSAGNDGAASANRPFGRSDDGLIDKAGNIRLDNLNQPESVNAVIREAAAANNDFIDARRGVISDQQVLDLADALGMQASDLNARKIGQAFNAEQVVAARKLLIQSAQAVRDAMAKAATGSDADVMAYAEAADRHRMIQEQVSGITAEAGRALRAFRAIGEEGQQTKALGDFLQASTGKTLFQMRREAQAGMLLDTPEQVSKFMQDTAKPTFGDMALEYWINGLISGPATHTTYAIGNALLALWKAVPETAVAAAIGKLRGGAERVYAGEVNAQLYGLVKGQRDGVKAAWKAAKSGLTSELPGEGEAEAQTSMLAAQPRPGGAIPGKLGEVIRLPSRGVATIHSYFRAIGYEQSIAQQAYRQAAAEGLDGDAFAARVQQLTTNPPPEMMEAARQGATDQTLMNQGGELTQKVGDLFDHRFASLGGFPALKLIDPFVKIGANVMSQALMERSPLGVLNADIRANLMGRNGPIARDTQIARIAVGSALGATAIGLAMQGLITGAGPSDPKEAAVWRLAGNQPYSVKIGSTWYAYHRLGPLAMIVGVAADMHDVGAAMTTHEAGQVANLVVSSLAKSLLDESFMRGPSELIQAVEDPDRYGARYVRSQLATLIPFSTGMAQVARAADPYAREARTTLDTISARLPFVSQGLLPRRDLFGNAIPNADDLGAAGLTSIQETRAKNDPVSAAMLRLGYYPAQPERKLVGVTLNDQQYDDYSRTAGRMAKMRLDALVNTPGFSALPDGVQTKTMQDIFASSRRAAGELIKMQNPAIIQQAVDNKRAFITQGRAALTH